MAGRVLRSSNGRFAGSTKGFRKGVLKSSGLAGVYVTNRTLSKEASKHRYTSKYAASSRLGKTFDRTKVVSKEWKGVPHDKTLVASLTTGRSNVKLRQLKYIERQVAGRHQGSYTQPKKLIAASRSSLKVSDMRLNHLETTGRHLPLKSAVSQLTSREKKLYTTSQLSHISRDRRRWKNKTNVAMSDLAGKRFDKVSRRFR